MMMMMVGCDGAAVFVLETCSAFICLGGVNLVPQPKVQGDLGIGRSPAVSGALGSSWSSGKKMG